MRLRTHMLSSPFFLVLASLFAGTPLAPVGPVLAATTVGAALPEVDKPHSLVGRLFPFSAWIHERFGHRGLTHSLLGLALVAGLAAPLALFARSVWLALLVGYTSHLVLDMATLEGVPLLWPKRTRHVFPGRDNLRIDQSSPAAERKELALSAIMVAGALALWPLTQTGLTSTLRRALGTLPESLPEYRKLAGEYEVFLTGTLQDRLTGLSHEGEWPIVGTYGNGYLIRVGEELRLVSEEGGSLHPVRVALKKGTPIHVVVQEWSFTGPIHRLLAGIDAKVEHYITGTLRLDRPVSLTFSPAAFPTIQGREHLTLTYARTQDLAALADAGVVEGRLQVIYRLRPGQSISVTTEASRPPEARPLEMKLRLQSLSDLLVGEGDVVAEGELMGYAYVPELAQKRQELALAQERYQGGLISAVELAKLSAEVEALEERAAIYAKFSGKVREIRLLGADAGSVEVVVVMVPSSVTEVVGGRVLGTSATPSSELLPFYRALPELSVDHGEVTYVVKAIDGDTVQILYQGRAQSARLVGLDTPETKHPRKGVECFGPEASRYTSTTLPRGTEVRITFNPLGQKRDKYDRLLVYLWVQLDDDEPLELFNAALIRLGYARMYPFFKFDRAQEFRNLEDMARKEARGLWGACGYEPYR